MDFGETNIGMFLVVRGDAQALIDPKQQLNEQTSATNGGRTAFQRSDQYARERPRFRLSIADSRGRV